jgi:hypothetical protein
MKTLFILFTLLASIANAGGLGVGLNHELVYIYATFVMLVLVIVGTDQFLKYVFKKMKQHHEKIDEQSSLEHHPE